MCGKCFPARLVKVSRKTHTKQLSIFFVEVLQRDKELREGEDYYDEWSKISAQELLTKAEQFLVKAKEIINIV